MFPLDNYRKIITNHNPRPHFTLEIINMQDSRDTIRYMKNSKALGDDTISIQTIKEFLPSIDSALLNVINTSISTNTYSTNLNIAKVMP